MNIIFATIVLFCTSSNLRSPCRQTPLHHRQSLSPSRSSLCSAGGNGKAGKSQGNVTAGKAGKGEVNVNAGKAGKAGKSQSQTHGNNADAGKAEKGQGNAGGWPSTSGNPSGSGRSNAAPKSNKTPTTLWEKVRLLEEKTPQQEESLKTMIRSLKQEKKALNKEKDALKKEKKALQKQLDNRPDVPLLFRGQYQFGRDNVADLSRLISMYLIDKPSNINRDRIYNCVRACVADSDDRIYYFTDLGGTYNGDLPEERYVDTRMLLATCLACNWFSNKQQKNIKSWHRKHFGH